VRGEVRGVMSGGVVGCVDGMSEEVMGSVGSDWSERIQRCESGVEIKRKFSCTVITVVLQRNSLEIKFSD